MSLRTYTSKLPPGTAAHLLSHGWLPPHAAADALGCTIKELDRMVRDGAIGRRSVSPGRYIYEVPTGRM